MSVPVQNFSTLSLSHATMQSARGSAREDKGKGSAPEEEDPNDESSKDDSDNSEAGEQREAAQHAEPKHTLALDFCSHHGAEDDRRYAFQMADAELTTCSVQVTLTDTGLPKCSCGAKRTCRHVAWLLEAFNGSGNGIVVSGPESNVYQGISSIGLGRLCEDLNWELREASEPDTEETQWQLRKDHHAARLRSQTRGMARHRMKEVRDILATLSHEPTDYYRRDIFENPESLTEDVFVPNDLDATMSRLLMQDDMVFGHFRSMVRRDTRAVDYFRKMNFKARGAFDLLDQYVQHGPIASQQVQYDLVWCAQTLVNIVDLISINVVERKPLSNSSITEAARALVSILVEVVKNRNKDVYQNSKIPRRREHGDPYSSRNLYQRLIGSSTPQNPPGNAFIIQNLEKIPEALPLLGDLEECQRVLGSIGWGPAPKPYRDRLDALIVRLRGQRTSSASAAKRPGSSLEGQAKRTR